MMESTPDFGPVFRFPDSARCSIGMGSAKPNWDEILTYVQKSADVYIRKRAFHLPVEQKEEIVQNAMLRIVEAYPDLDESLGWKAFVQTHCWGAVMDYLRDGQGFKETDWKFGEAADELETIRRPCLRMRVAIEDQGEAVDVETTAALYGIFAPFPEETVFRPNWNLIARMARVDPDIHLVAKILLGCTQTELSNPFGVSREMLSQRVRRFWRKLDSPKYVNSPWVNQTVFAFGLWELFHMPPKDMGPDVGWNLEPINLFDNRSPEFISMLHQMAFSFDSIHAV